MLRMHRRNYQEVLTTIMKHYTIINVRKLAALDIVFHGTTFILIEFALALFLCSTVGLLIFQSANHAPCNVILGSFFLGVSLNYIPLLLHAINIVKHKSAQQEVAYELEHKDRYAGKYMLQSILLLLMPLAMLLLAAYQDVQKRSHR
ncbi:MAG TPA: hypothetical protein VF844_10765 [Ktedonobacteraceae bacterium]